MKPASIQICPVIPLNRLPPSEVDVIRRFLFGHIRGLDEQSDKRWKRWWGTMWRAPEGEGFAMASLEARSVPFHKLHRAVLQRLFDSQDRFRHIEKLHDWWKLSGGIAEWVAGPDHKIVAIPKSTAFDVFSEDEMREAHAAMVDALFVERNQRFLFKSVKPSHRQEMVDAVLLNPKD